MAKVDRPEPGKVYALTGGMDALALSNGNTWAESEVRTCARCGRDLPHSMEKPCGNPR